MSYYHYSASDKSVLRLCRELHMSWSGKRFGNKQDTYLLEFRYRLANPFFSIYLSLNGPVSQIEPCIPIGYDIIDKYVRKDELIQ